MGRAGLKSADKKVVLIEEGRVKSQRIKRLY